jgi:hypothetical protein
MGILIGIGRFSDKSGILSKWDEKMKIIVGCGVRDDWLRALE